VITPARHVALAALAAALVLAVAACGGDDGGDDDAGATTGADDETTTTEDPQAALESEVVAAYEASWTDFIAAGDPPSPDAESLTNHLTGDALAVSRNLLNQLRSEGVVLRGTYEFNAGVSELDSDRAVVEDCGVDRMQVVDPGSGRVVEDYDDEPDGIVAELTLEGGSWKVTSYTDDSGVCT
jgi:hypothetical protein